VNSWQKASMEARGMVPLSWLMIGQRARKQQPDGGVS